MLYVTVKAVLSPRMLLIAHIMVTSVCLMSQDGRTLLHFACQQSANTEVIVALLQRLGTSEAIAEALSAVDEVLARV